MHKTPALHNANKIGERMIVMEHQGSRNERLRGRSKRCVCKYCGGELKIKSIIFNEFIEARSELYCPECDRIEFGVEPEIYRCAKYYVEEFKYNAYKELDDAVLTRQMTIAKVCEIMDWVVKNIGVANDNGFQVPLNMKSYLLGETIYLTDDTLKEIQIISGEENE
jgi:hypothetical protein